MCTFVRTALNTAAQPRATPYSRVPLLFVYVRAFQMWYVCAERGTESSPLAPGATRGVSCTVHSHVPPLGRSAYAGCTDCVAAESPPTPII